MPPERTPPHLAQPQLTYATSDQADDFITAVNRGFHEDYVPERAALWRAVIEWDRTFGLTVDSRWIATCGAFSRLLTVPGGQVPAAAVTVVTVAPAYRRRGLLRQMMEHQLTDVQRRGSEPVAILWAAESLIYGRFGYGHAAPRLRVSGATRDTAFLPSVELGPGSVDEVGRDEFLAAAPGLHASWLAERPGGLNRPPAWWDLEVDDPAHARQGAKPLRFALHFSATGTPDGYALFRIKPGSSDVDNEVTVDQVDAGSPAAYAALWRYLLDFDLVRRFRRRNAPFDEPLRQLVSDPRTVATELTDALYLRLVDLPAALEARAYSTEIDLTVEVHDPLLPANDGRWRLQTGTDGASVGRVDRAPEITLGTRELAAGYLGGTPLTALHRAGLITEHRPGAVRDLTAALHWPTPPFCPDDF